jgi:hypothetical protein
MTELAHHRAIDVQKRSRPFHFDDAAEALRAGAYDLELHGCVGRRRNVPSSRAIALAQVAPRSRNVTSTPNELEFGLQPNVARKTRPFRMGAS